MGMWKKMVDQLYRILSGRSWSVCRSYCYFKKTLSDFGRYSTTKNLLRSTAAHSSCVPGIL